MNCLVIPLVQIEIDLNHLKVLKIFTKKKAAKIHGKKINRRTIGKAALVLIKNKKIARVTMKKIKNLRNVKYLSETFLFNLKKMM